MHVAAGELLSAQALAHECSFAYVITFTKVALDASQVFTWAHTAGQHLHFLSSSSHNLIAGNLEMINFLAHSWGYWHTIKQALTRLTSQRKHQRLYCSANQPQAC